MNKQLPPVLPIMKNTADPKINYLITQQKAYELRCKTGFIELKKNFSQNTSDNW